MDEADDAIAGNVSVDITEAFGDLVNHLLLARFDRLHRMPIKPGDGQGAGRGNGAQSAVPLSSASYY